MSNYPNMSYCMNQNTFGALRQIFDTIQEDHDGCIDEYLASLSQDEAYYFRRILGLSRDLLEDADSIAPEFSNASY